MTHFVRNGSAYYVSNHTEVLDALPVATYVVMRDPQGIFYLEKITPLRCGVELYGDISRRADRVINTFVDRPTSTGILLSGSKGSGKTLFARLLSETITTLGYPTIVVNQSHTGDGFNAVLKSIEQPCMVFFDEFEKVYNDKEQQTLLTVFDGSYSDKRLYVVTTNNTYRISEYMINRPGRFYYHFTYAGLDEAFIVDYCQKNLHDKSAITDVVRVSQAFSDFNFDALKAVVEEMNRYKEPIKEAIRFLNVTPGETASYDVRDLTVKGEWKDKIVKITIPNRSLNPYMPFEANGYDSSHEYVRDFQVEPGDIVSIGYGVLKFDNDELSFTLEKRFDKSFSFSRLL